MSAKGAIKVEKPVKTGSSLLLEGPALSSLMMWLPRPGEAFTIIDGQSRLFRARLLELSLESALLLPFEEMGEAQKGPEIILLQALPERERMETIIQKTAELGVSAILPFKSEKSISIEELDGRQKRSHNWGAVALKAARQSRRLDIPDVVGYSSFQEALDQVKSCGLKIILWEGAQKALKELLSELETPLESAALMSGPEGGFTEKEIAAAVEAGFVAVNLGQRILRTETSAIFGSGLLRYELGG